MIPFDAFGAEKKKFSINTGASCISKSCHQGMAKKKYIHPVASDGSACVQCHTPLEKGSHIFKGFSDKSSVLCYQCHENKAKGKYVHSPVKEGGCTYCHNPHQSDNPKLLKGKYPDGLYASYSDNTYQLCFKCHSNFKKVLSEPRTLKDTQFRNGNLNLHQRHVNAKKGRACSSCHHHHSSENPKLITKSFPFGKKILTIKYEKSETGGSCAPACHVPVKYDRYEPVDNTIKTTPRQGIDATAQELKQSKEPENKIKTEPKKR